MNIAIVRLSSLGDIIFCMASVQLIRKRFPDCSLTWVADARFADILDHNPDVDRVIKLDLKMLKGNFTLGGLAAEWGKLQRAGRFDLAIDLHGMIKSAVITRKLGSKTSGFGFDVVKEPLAGLLYSTRSSPAVELPAVLRYARLAADSLGFDLDENELVNKKPFLFYHDTDLRVSDPYFRADRKNVLLIPETSIDYKNYPKEKFVDIAKGLGENIVFCHGSDRELATARFVAERCPGAVVLPRLNLNQLKAAISRADLVIGGDTGPTHIAWANNIPSITLFGATPPCVPSTPVNRILKSQTKVRPRKPDPTDLSISQIPTDEVLRVARELLAGTR